MKKLVIFFLILSVTTSYSQFERSYLSVNGSFTTPLGEFKEGDEFDEDGFSLSGFSGGVQYTLPLWNQYVAMLAEISMVINFIDRKEVEDENLPTNVLTDEPDGGSYFNIPILFGLKPSISVASKLKIYATAQIGFNIMNESDMEGEVVSDRTVDLEFDPDVTLALGAGAGILIAQQLSFGIRFLSLGEPEFDYEGKLSDSSLEFESEREFKMAVFQLMIGYDF